MLLKIPYSLKKEAKTSSINNDNPIGSQKFKTH